MQTTGFNQTVDFTAYRQVLKGLCNPVSSSKSAFKSALSLVRSANTYNVCSALSKEESMKTVSSTDLTFYGYYTNSDIDISFSQVSGLKTYQAIIKPKVVYSLGEDISLPDPPDERANFYRDFFADELERLKIRAEKNLIAAPSEKKVRSFSYCNYQLLNKLFHESRIYFNTLSTKPRSKVHPSDLYIIYILNLFIIRSLVFYYKFFKPYLDIEPISEDKLRLNFQKEIPRILKYPWLFIQRPPLYEIMQDCPDSSMVADNNTAYSDVGNSSRLPIPEALLQEALEMIQLKSAIKLNGPMNLLVDSYYKMMTKKIKDDMLYMDATNDIIAKILSFHCVDKHNSPLNYKTIRAYLKASNVTKRPGIDERNNQDENTDDSNVTN